jgi:hypothetical protein
LSAGIWYKLALAVFKGVLHRNHCRKQILENSEHVMLLNFHIQNGHGIFMNRFETFWSGEYAWWA